MYQTMTDQGQKIDGDGEGAMPNWVPVFHSDTPSDFPGPVFPLFFCDFQLSFSCILTRNEGKNRQGPEHRIG